MQQVEIANGDQIVDDLLHMRIIACVATGCPPNRTLGSFSLLRKETPPLKVKVGQI